MIKDDRVETMKLKKEDEEEIVQEQEDNPKPKKKAKKKPAKKVEEKKEAQKETMTEKTEEENNELSEEKAENNNEEPKKEKKRAGKIITTIIVLIVIIAIILFIANISYLFPKKEAAKESDVAAVVNGEPITQEELNNQYEVLPAQYKLVMTKEAFLDQIIDEKLLLQEAKKQGINVDETRVDDIINSIISQNKITIQEFEDKLKTQGITLDYIRGYYTNQITISDLLNKTVFAETDVTLPGRIRASHILVNSSEEAQKIKEELEKGADFAKIAEEKSLDAGSKIKGGDLGYFTKGQMVKEFEDAAFDLEIGQISDVVKTDFGYHIIKLIDKNQEEKKRLSEARIDEQRLVSEDMGKAITGYLDQLRSKAVITKPTAASAIKTFKTTSDNVCTENGKPIIRLFSTTTCPRCKWIKTTFDDTVKEYGDSIVAYHWELDAGDDTLTPEVEKAIPKDELEVFKKYNPQNTVPTFVFGCKYYRIGNAYEDSSDLPAEKAEFKAVIEALLSGT